MSVLLAATAALLFSVGTHLVLQRKLSRIIVGIGLLGHGANVLFVAAGRRGSAPLIGRGDADNFADPFPQALVLTAIVISFGVTAFLLALAYRSWLLTEDDDVADDPEDRAMSRIGARDQELSDERQLEAMIEPNLGGDDEASAESKHTGRDAGDAP